MEVEKSSETFETVYQIIQHHIPQENIPHIPHIPHIYHIPHISHIPQFPHIPHIPHHLNRKPQQITNYDDAVLLLLWSELLTSY